MQGAAYDMGKKISVIIPCYCAAKWLGKCCASLADQTIGMKEMELIFVDDASDDGGETWNTLLAFEKQYPDSVIVIKSPVNKRQGGARNLAMPYASGEYLSFLDADDWLEPFAYEKLYAYAKRTDAEIVQFEQYRYFGEHDLRPYTENEEETLVEIHTVEERARFLTSFVMTTGFSNKFYKRDFIIASKAQFAEHVFYEEPMFTYPLMFEVERFATLKEKLYYYRCNTSGTMMHEMNQMNTLTDHIGVQTRLFEKMSGSHYYLDYKDEIELYFIHAFLYETLMFMKSRNFPGAYPIFQRLGKMIREHYPKLWENKYLQAAGCEKQRGLLELAMKNAGEEEFSSFYERLS